VKEVLIKNVITDNKHYNKPDS